MKGLSTEVEGVFIMGGNAIGRGKRMDLDGILAIVGGQKRGCGDLFQFLCLGKF